ncbi:MAG TPA: substrate-binding domain-containing protein [Beijerinckiaceae bacterium]
MTILRLLSGGAAQGLVAALAPGFEAETGCRLEGEFGAVGAMAAKLRAGGPADLLILTAALIAELEREGHAVSGSAADVGVVQTAVAVRAGDQAPPVADAEDLRTALLAADEIYFPDPQQATAGIHFAKVLRSLGVWEEPGSRLKAFPNGAAAMRALAASTGARPIGCTQATEILGTPGVALAGPLPPGCGLATTYTAAVCARASLPEQASRFVALLTAASSRESRRRAGFL